ncbi:MAG: repeat-containing protein [Adhaeribacter sp.]|nr:repeat-containing protein [Adhaeribacter sp.]
MLGKAPDTSTENKADVKTNSNTYVGGLEVSIQNGKSLAAQHCQSCHLLPDPALLDKENWQTALAMMAPRLGIYDHYGKLYPIYTDIDQRFYPAEGAMSAPEWQNIIDYYTAIAPSVLPAQKRLKPIKRRLPGFSLELPSQLFYRKHNTVSFIKIDTSVKPHRLFVNRASSNTLFVLNTKLQVVDSLHTDGPIIDIDFQVNKLVASKIGSDLFGNNAKRGSIFPLQTDKHRTLRADGPPLFDTLARPLQITSADINKDQKTDYLICEFGNMNGSLLWMENKGRGKFVRHDLRAVAGATKAFIQDYNQDGLPDIWAQFAQGEEGVFLFTNKGNGLFGQKQVVRFPPTYGSSSFELDDFNQDGFPDIVYTCGDRGDGINQLKPYHGVYVLMNNGKNEFTQRYFFPINGCMKAMARDFDKDGDLDIAAIGFFTDNRQPEEGFVYLENKGNWDFEPHALPLETSFAKATTMDVADLDADGKLDIVLGHGFIGNKAMDGKKPLFIVLKNKF